MKKIYYKHIIIRSGDSDDVEKEINEYVKNDESINIISLNVTPERIGSSAIGNHIIPNYWYHINLVYTSNE